MALLGLVRFALPGLAAHLVAADDVAHRVPLLQGLVQLPPQRLAGLLGLPDLVLLLQQLLAHLLVPVVEFLGGGGQGGQQLLGLPGGGALQPFPLLKDSQLLSETARRAQGLLRLAIQVLQLAPAILHFFLKLLHPGLALGDLPGNGARPAFLLV